MSSGERSAEEHITLDFKSDGIAVITLNMPENYNALTHGDYMRVGELLDNAGQRSDVRVTVITGRGKYFSSGANVKQDRMVPEGDVSPRKHFLTRFSTNNFDLAKSFYDHPKILVAALNGPVIGLSAAMISWCDFIFAADHAWLLAPFTTLGLVPEGGSSLSFINRMGLAKANEALILGKKFSAQELLAIGFVNKTFQATSDEAFLSSVLDYFRERIEGLNPQSLLLTKALIRQTLKDRNNFDAVNAREIFQLVERFVDGAPLEAFARMATKEKRHKL